MSDSLQPHGLQHARPPCPLPTLEVYSNSCPFLSKKTSSQPLLGPEQIQNSGLSGGAVPGDLPGRGVGKGALLTAVSQTSDWVPQSISAHVLSLGRVGPHSVTSLLPLGWPCGSVVKYPPAMQGLQEMRVPSLGQEDPLEEGMATHSSILA